jgi:plastocyanin
MLKVIAERRRALSTVIAAVAIIVIIIVAAGGVLLLSEHRDAVTSSTSTSSTAQVVGSSMISSNSSFSTSGASSSSITTIMTSSSSTISSSSHYSGRVIVSFNLPYTPFVASDVNVTYPVLVTGLGKLPDSIILQSNDTDGITMTFSPSNISLPTSTPVTATVSVGSSVNPGSYVFDTAATGGGASLEVTLQVEVVRFLVEAAPAFVPGNLTVPVGSTVTWVILNGNAGEHYNGSQNIVFSNNMASSPLLLKDQTWSFTFNQTGSFPYESTYTRGTGKITVVAS